MTVGERVAGRSAIASGIVTLVAAAVLVVFFVVEAPALVESGDVDQVTVFGSTNDALIALSLLLLVPVAVFVARVGEPRQLHQVAGMVGVVGLVLGAAFMTTTALRIIDYGTNAILVGAAFTLIASWLLALTIPHTADGLLGRPARLAGGVAGVALLLIAGFAAIAGPSVLADPAVMMSSPFLIALLGLGTAGLHFATPVWAILSGRRWLASGK